MRISPESALAWATAAVGAVGVASALTPELASRSELVQGVLPPGVPAAARTGTLAFGLGLVWLSRSLARRRRRAWQLAVAVVVAIALSHLAKGLDVEEAASAAGLLVALLAYRRRFDVPGDPTSWRPLLATATALAAATAVALRLGPPHGPDRLEDLFEALALVLAARALWLWLRPLSQLVRQSAEERGAARELVQAYGRDSLDFFALRRDKSYLFSPSRRAFLAYRVVGGAALVSGDPIGDEEDFDALLAEFRRSAHAHGWRMAVLGASPEQLARYRRLGLRALPLGEEAVLRPASFSLEGRAIRKVRQSARRLERAGYRFRVVPVGEAGPQLRAQLDAVSAAWRGRKAERGFSMAMDELYAADTLLALAEDELGLAAGFLHLVPSPASGGYSLSTMRRRAGTPNGLMEFLVVETLAWAAERGVPELSLNFCAFGYVLRGEAAGWRRRARHALQPFDRFFQLERLLVFNRKFLPDWRPRYLCVERLSDLPGVALAYLRVESLLAAPRPRRVPAGR